jgi:hypothetical protein
MAQCIQSLELRWGLNGSPHRLLFLSYFFGLEGPRKGMCSTSVVLGCCSACFTVIKRPVMALRPNTCVLLVFLLLIVISVNLAAHWAGYADTPRLVRRVNNSVVDGERRSAYNGRRLTQPSPSTTPNSNETAPLLRSGVFHLRRHYSTETPSQLPDLCLVAKPLDIVCMGC